MIGDERKFGILEITVQQIIQMNIALSSALFAATLIVPKSREEVLANFDCWCWKDVEGDKRMNRI